MKAPTPFDIRLPRIQAPFNLVDVGARWGALSAWSAFGDKANVICFEPDGEEAARLQEGSPPNVRYLPVALGAVDGTLSLTVTREPACSSVYPPVRTLYTDYPGLSVISPERQVSVPARRLDGVLSEEGLRTIDAIKLDTQGSELDILRGAGDALKSVEVVDIEVEFNPIYQGQNLFCDVDRFLRDQGFVLWRLSDLVHYALEILPGSSSTIMLATAPGDYQRIPVDGGQIYWAQAQYVRADLPRTGSATLPNERAIRVAALVGAYGFWDLAIEVLRRGGDQNLSLEVADLLKRDHQPDVERDLSAEIDQLREQISRQEQTISEQENRAREFERSSSWRMTAPLRAIKRLIK